MQTEMKSEKWEKINIRSSKLERITEVLKTHPEFDSAPDFVDQVVTLALDRLEGGRK